jgi:nucleotide-binding universal stress UspA family protein
MRRPDLHLARRRVKRFARRTAAVRYRSIVVPLLGRAETGHALDLACRLAAERGAQIVLVAPLLVPNELPLDAHFAGEERALRERLEQAAGVADSYGVAVRRRLLRTRESGFGQELAELAYDERAELLVVGAPVESRRGFRRPFPPEIMAIARDAPCRVMIVTGPVAAASTVREWPGGDGRPTSSNAFSGRTHSSRRRTATSARRSTTRSA